MALVDRKTIIQKLRDFHEHVASFTWECRRNLTRSEPPAYQLRITVQELTIEAASVRPIVEAAVGKKELTSGNVKWDVWVGAFARNYENSTHMDRIIVSLDAVLQSVEATIGYFESKDLIDAISRPVEPKSIQRPKVFIAHDGASELRTRLEIECWRMMLEPVVAEQQPSLDESVDSKVDRLLEGCQFGIVLARSEAGTSQDSFKIPRGNVIDEISRIRAELGDNYIILLEAGLTLPSNQATGVVYETFDKENFAEALLKVVQKLRSRGLI